MIDSLAEPSVDVMLAGARLPWWLATVLILGASAALGWVSGRGLGRLQRRRRRAVAKHRRRAGTYARGRFPINESAAVRPALSDTKVMPRQSDLTVELPRVGSGW